MKGRRFLVTGAAGFIGSHLCQKLLALGARVVGLDNFHDFYSPALKRRNLLALTSFDHFSFCQADICDARQLAELLEPHERALAGASLIHLAARAGVRPSLLDPVGYVQTNVQGTIHLLELARKLNIEHFLLASSSSVYGESPGEIPFKETQDISRPISPYASTKAMAESIVHTYHHLYGLRVAILRFFTVYGARQRPDLAIHKFTQLIDQGLPIPVFGDGSAQRDYTFVEDIVDGILRAARYDTTPFEIFNLGGSRTVSLSKLIQLIESALGKKAILFHQPPQPGDVPVTCADLSKSGRLLGYQPRTPIEEGIPKFVA
ncbi:MAG: GDP-mannose 4,6-dehydratase [Vulcanimicrobiota bacterium]